MLVSLDTNVLVYANRVNDVDRQIKALEILERLPAPRIRIAAQALGELFNVLTLKAKMPRVQAADRVIRLRGAYSILETNLAAIENAVNLATDHPLSIWDAIILSASASAGCRILLSEDMQHGFEWGGVTIINPFLPHPHPMLSRALAG
jgi:predicted nucleic acid-binding protein